MKNYAAGKVLRQLEFIVKALQHHRLREFNHPIFEIAIDLTANILVHVANFVACAIICALSIFTPLALPQTRQSSTQEIQVTRPYFVHK
jgi:hypothetical protein